MRNWEDNWELGVYVFLFIYCISTLHCIDTSTAYPRISFKSVLAFRYTIVGLVMGLIRKWTLMTYPRHVTDKITLRQDKKACVGDPLQALRTQARLKPVQNNR